MTLFFSNSYGDGCIGSSFGLRVWWCRAMEHSQSGAISAVLRHLSLGELLDRAFILYRNHFVSFFVIGLFPRGVAFAIALWADSVYLRAPRLSGSVFVTVFVQWIITLPVYMMALAVSHAVTMLLVSSAYLQRPIQLREACAKAKPYFGTLAWLAMQTTVRVLLGFILFVIPGVFLTLNYSVSVPAAVFENLKASKALERSTQLTEGYRGRIFGLYCISGLISDAVSARARYLVRRSLSGFSATVFVELTRFLTIALITPAVLIAFGLIYYDLRVRYEAFDLQFMAASL